MLRVLVLLAAVVLFSTGCSSLYMPSVPGPYAPPVPTQQLLLAGTIDRAISNIPIPPAVNRATVAVDVSGVYLDRGLAAYMKETLQTVLAESGAIIVDYDPRNLAFADTQPPDWFASLSVRAGGIDIESEAPYYILEDKFLNAVVDMRLAVRRNGSNEVAVARGTGEDRVKVGSRINLWLVSIRLPNRYSESRYSTSVADQIWNIFGDAEAAVNYYD